MARVADEVTISAAYSTHDFRHLFATTEDRKDRDIYRVWNLLGYGSVLVKEAHLRGLGEVDRF